MLVPMLAVLGVLAASPAATSSDATSRAIHGAPAACPRNPEPPAPAKAGSANVVLVLCDDMDLALGGFTPLKKTAKLLSAKGATAKNYFIRAFHPPSSAATLAAPLPLPLPLPLAAWH